MYSKVEIWASVRTNEHGRVENCRIGNQRLFRSSQAYFWIRDTSRSILDTPRSTLDTPRSILDTPSVMLEAHIRHSLLFLVFQI